MRPIVASDLMTPQVLTVDEEMTVPELADFLLDNEISGAAVENSDGELVGVVSLVDVAAAATDAGQSDADGPGFYFRGWQDTFSDGELDELDELELDDESLLVRDIMNPRVHSVSADARVSEIASKMLDEHIHRLLVTEDDEVVGIISTSDLLGLLIEED